MKVRALAIALLAAAACAPASASVANPLTDHLAERLLIAHNRERDAVGVPRLTWSESLAEDARAWGRHLARLGYLVHPEDAPDELDPEGENLWAGTRRHYPLEQMIGMWLAERKNFRPGRFPDVSSTGEIDDIGHYTQIVWRSTKAVGCAIVEGDEDEYLVCRYRGGGNVMGEKPY